MFVRDNETVLGFRELCMGTTSAIAHGWNLTSGNVQSSLAERAAARSELERLQSEANQELRDNPQQEV